MIRHVCRWDVLVIGFCCIAAPLSAQDKKGQKLALLVGVRDYDHPEMRPLRYSENDVVELGKVLKEAGYDVTLLADGVGEKTAALTPSRANIDKHLADVLAKCKRREDTILIAFAGHGIQPEGDKDAYFCPKDANPKIDPKKSMVSLNKIYAALEASFAGVKVLLVDACRDDPKLARGRTGITGDSAPRPPRGVAVLFSCAAGEVAYEHEKYKHGVFFHHVLEGMRGKAKNSDDEITFTSLAEYVARYVARDVPKLIGEGAQQSPNLKADLAGAPPVLAYIKRVDTPPEKKIILPTDPSKISDAIRRQLDEIKTLRTEESFDTRKYAVSSDLEGYKKLVATAAALEREGTLRATSWAYDALAWRAHDVRDWAAREMFFRAGLALPRRTKDDGIHHSLSFGLYQYLMNSKRYAEAAAVAPGDLAFPEDRLLPPIPLAYNLLESLSKQGKFDQALRMLDDHESKDKYFRYYLRYDVLLDAGRYDEAATLCDKALKTAKSADDRMIRTLHLARVHEVWGKVDLATELLEKLIDLYPAKDEVYWFRLRLGVLWAKHGHKLAEAEKHLDFTAQQRRAEVEAKKAIFVPGTVFAGLGLVCLRQERFKEAKDYLLQAVEDPYSKYELEVCDNLGDAQLALGERAEALAIWREGLRLNREDFSHKVVQLRKTVEEKIAKHSK